MKKLSIAQRLYAGLALITLVGSAATVAAFIEMNSIDRQWDSFKKNELTRLDLVSEANIELGRGVQEFKNLVLRSVDYAPKALQHLTNIHRIAARYQALPVNEEERKYLDVIRGSVDNYQLAVQKAVNLKRAGITIPDIDKTIAGADRPIAEATDKLKKIVTSDVEAAGVIIQNTLDQNKKILLIGLLITVCFSTLLGYTLVRSIKSGLAVANAAIDNLAKGDFSKEIDRGRHDEIGQLLNRTAGMAQVLKAFLAAQLAMARQHNRDGLISKTIDEFQFSGAYRDMARNMNEMVKGHTGVQTQFVDLMVEYANGDFERRMEPLPGERKKISDAAGKVRSELEAAAEAARYNARVKAALDHVRIPVRIANDDGEILYVNNVLNDTLHKYEAAFRRQIPGFDAGKVVGGSIGMFYSDRKSAIAELRSITRATSSRLSLGGRDYDVVTSPVFSEKGERLGTASQWNDITEQLDAEKEIAAVVDAAASGDFKKRIEEAGKAGFPAENCPRLEHGARHERSRFERNWKDPHGAGARRFDPDNRGRVPWRVRGAER